MRFKKPENIEWGGWAIDEQEWNQIAALIERLNIKSVVEFGMGVSTYLFKQLPVYLGYETHIKTLAQHDGITIIQRDLKSEIQPGHMAVDMRIAKVKRFDLAFVDGPKASDTADLVDGKARVYSVKAALQMADKILMHDTLRDGEKATIATYLSGTKRTELISDRGLTLFERVN